MYNSEILSPTQTLPVFLGQPLTTNTSFPTLVQGKSYSSCFSSPELCIKKEKPLTQRNPKLYIYRLTHPEGISQLGRPMDALTPEAMIQVQCLAMINDN